MRDVLLHRLCVGVRQGTQDFFCSEGIKSVERLPLAC